MCQQMSLRRKSQSFATDQQLGLLILAINIVLYSLAFARPRKPAEAHPPVPAASAPGR